MKRRKRTEILIQGAPELAKKMAEAIQVKYTVQVIEPPQQILVMIKVREGAKRSLFYLGELLATQAKVKILEKIGLGIVAGHEEALPLYLAIIDAAYAADLPETKAWGPLLWAENAEIEKNQLEEQGRLEKTKVKFNMMEGQLS